MIGQTHGQEMEVEHDQRLEESSSGDEGWVSDHVVEKEVVNQQVQELELGTDHEQRVLQV